MKQIVHLWLKKSGRALLTTGLIGTIWLSAFANGTPDDNLALTVTMSGTNPLCGGFATGSATATPWDGVPPYSFVWNTGATTPTINNLPAGTYSVTVTDAVNATAYGSITLTEPPPLSATVSVSCGNPGTATANPSGGVPGYTYSWSNGATSQTIVNLPPGQYCVTITDANSCGVVACGTVGSGPSVSVSTTPAGCSGANTGSATASPSSGTPPYTYAWSNGGTSQTIYNLAPGSYSVTVTDANGCSGTGSGVVTSSSGGFPIWLTTTPPSSCGANNGSITANPMGGVPPYTYAWNNGGTTQTISNLPVGTYTVTVTDGGGCTATKTTTLTAPSNVTVWASATDETCAGANDGTATASGMGGTQPYTYQWSNGQTGPNLFGLSPGIYSVTATDFYGCSGSATVTVGAGSAFTLSISAQNVTSCGANNGSATAVPSGGTPPFSYQWNTGATTQTITNLPAGFYSVTATDANGCSKATSVWITEPPNLTVSIQATPLVCNNANNGIATAFTNGGTAPFSYAWSNGGTTQTISNLGAGTYSVTVTDVNGCQGTATTTIANSNLVIDVIITTPTCYGSSDGQIEVSGWNGTPPYTYQWNNGSTSPVLNNVSAGTYSVTVYDSGGCSVFQNITVNDPPMILINFSTTQPGCSGGNGAVTANVSGGVPPYTYQWSNGGNGPSISNLAPGTYVLTVTDAHNCVQTGAVNIVLPPPLSVNVTGNEPACNGGNNGSAMAQVSGGTPPFSYQWSNGANTQTIAGLSAGGYTVTVTDGQGCTGTGNIWLNEPPVLGITMNATPQVCPGQSDGMVSAFPFGGTPPYSYQWNNGSTAQTISGLPAGTYSVTVTDAHNCTQTASATILASDLITDVAKQDVICFGESSGSILVSGWAGTPPYTYLWNTGATTPDIMNLPAGTYSVTVTDAAGCSITEVIIINQPPPLTINMNAQPAGCTTNNGTATANVSGGVPPYMYAWNTGATTQTITGLAPGTYSVTIQDANYCTKSATVTVGGGTNFNVSINAGSVTCPGGNDGFAFAMPLGGLAPYSYQWNTGATGSMISGLPAGNYAVTVTDANGCSGSANTSISQPLNIVLSVNSTNETCAGAHDGTASANVLSGGTPPFSYQWNTGQTTPNINNLAPGTYFVTITDANGCQKTGQTVVAPGNNLSVNINASNVSCFGSSDGSATASAFGGIAPYTYIWNTGQNSATINGLPAGNYAVTVTDANGCSGTANTSISQPPSMHINLTKNNPTCGQSNGSVSASASGGTPGYTYHWNTGATSSSINGLSAGTYTVTVTDANGCTQTSSTTLAGSSAVAVSTLVISSTCAGAQNGAASASATGGTPPYTYQWSNGATGNTVYGLASGTYTVTVTSSNGCTGTGSVFIPTAPSPSCSASVVQQPTTSSSNDGVATVNASGGTPPYTYQWSNGQTTQTATGLDEGTYSVTVTDFNGCTCVSSVTLEAPTGNCDNVTSAGEICCNQTLCGPGNDPAPLTETVAPSGGSGPLEYLWMYSTIPGPFNPNIWTVIPGANGPNYDPGPIYETTFFVRCVRRANCTDYYETNIITIDIGNVAVAEINGPNLTCVGDVETYTATAAPGATYLWNFGSGANPPTSTNQSQEVSWSTWGIKTVTLTVTKNGCVSTDILEVNVTNNPVFCGNGLVIDVTPISQSVVYVNWEFETPLYDSLKFVVERSPDGHEFEPLATLAYESDNTSSHYEYFDSTPKKGRSFYRVRLIDPESGLSTLSNTEEVLLIADLPPVFLYPNPTSGELFAEIIQDYAHSVSLDIYTSNGILLESVEVPDDHFRQFIDLSGYPSGLYIFIVRFDGMKEVPLRVIKE